MEIDADLRRVIEDLVRGLEPSDVRDLLDRQKHVLTRVFDEISRQVDEPIRAVVGVELEQTLAALEEAFTEAWLASPPPKGEPLGRDHWNRVWLLVADKLDPPADA